MFEPGGRLAESWRLATLRERTSDEVGILVTHLFARSGIPIDAVSGIILASVVPPLTRTMEEMAERYFGRSPLTVDPATNTGMTVLYQPASDVGADRVVNAVAAYEVYGRAGRKPIIVVDFGTATTFDAISAAGEYIGGVICPGIGISADALFQRAARLPRVDVRKPAAVIGRTTVTSMQSGLSSVTCRWSMASSRECGLSSTGVTARVHRDRRDGQYHRGRNDRDRTSSSRPHLAGPAADLGAQPFVVTAQYQRVEPQRYN